MQRWHSAIGTESAWLTVPRSFRISKCMHEIFLMTELTSFEPPSIIQIVLGSCDLPFCKHFYTTIFGFAGGGDRLTYNRHNGAVMGFGGWGGATILYMVGRQELLQLEFWTHTTPPQRPLPAEWRPNDIGFCRIGISVPDFDTTLERLIGFGISTLTPPVFVDGLRRVCSIDPTVGIPIEIMEEGASLPGKRDKYHDLQPAVVYAALSVTNLDEAVAYFGEVVGLKEVDVKLHEPDAEHLWGLSNASRKITALQGGSVFLEIVQYETPAGRPRPSPDRLDRQGFKTIAVGYRDPAQTAALFERVKGAGLGWTVMDPASFIGGNHVVGAVAHHMKTLSVPLEVERQFGYSPALPQWWEHPAPSNGLDGTNP